MLIRPDILPLEIPRHGGVGNDSQLFIARKVVSYIVVVNSPRMTRAGMADQQSNRNGSPRTLSEYAILLFSTLFALSTRVSAEVEHVDVVEFFGDAFSHPGHCGSAKLSRIGDEAHNALVSYAIARPAEGTHI